MRTRTLALAGMGVALSLLLAACGSTAASPQGSAVAAAAADISFAQLMIPHHQQAVEMADLARGRASSPEVEQLAVQIKAAQDPEIQVMSDWLREWGAPLEMGDDHGSHDMGGMTMSGMMTDEDMQALANATGSEFDRLWLQMMIAHHQGAISMADEVRAESTNADVTALAREVIAAQAAEIDTMQKLLTE